MKYIWNMTDKEIWIEGMTAGALVTGIGVVAGTSEGNFNAAALGGLFLSSMSAFGLIAKKLQEIEQEVKA